jgi:hypothetical protein
VKGTNAMQRQHALLRRSLRISPHIFHLPEHEKPRAIHDLMQRVEVVDWRRGVSNRAYLRVVKPTLVFKGVYVMCGYNDWRNAIAELELPVGAVFHFSSRNAKCRATRARVVRIYAIDAEGEQVISLPKPPRNARSTYDTTFMYHVGALVKPNRKFTTGFRRDTVCASGIHFYFDQRDAIRFIC